MLKHSLLAGAAVVALTGAAMAQPASKVTNVQLNLFQDQAAKAKVHSKLNIENVYVGKDLNGSAVAVGDNLSVDVANKDKTANVLNVQVNALASSQQAGTYVSGVHVERNADLSAAAIGNNFGSDSAGSLDAIASIQLNGATAGQSADVDVSRSTVEGTLTATGAAVGNNLNLATTKGDVSGGLVIQANGLSSRQVSNVSVSDSGYRGEIGGMDLTSQAVANSASFSSKKGDVTLRSVGQLNGFDSLQAATLDVDHVKTYGKTQIATDAIGNNASLDAGGNATLEGGLLSGQANGIRVFGLGIEGGDQYATTTIEGSRLLGKVDASTVAVANNLNVNAGDKADVDYGQVNLRAKQAAKTDIAYSRLGKTDIVTAAIGNNASVDGRKVDVSLSQANKRSVQVAKTTLDHVAARKLDIATQAVGSNLAVDASVVADVDASQSNSGFLTQKAFTSLDGVHAKAATVVTAAVGDNIDISGGTLKSASLSQVNDGAQFGGAAVYGGTFRSLDVSTQAVGTNVSIDMDNLAAAQIDQTNFAPQFAATTLRGIYVAHDLSVASTAVGNNASIAGAKVEASSFQTNLGNQTAISRLGGSFVGGNATVGAQAVGNSVSVRIK